MLERKFFELKCYAFNSKKLKLKKIRGKWSVRTKWIFQQSCSNRRVLQNRQKLIHNFKKTNTTTQETILNVKNLKKNKSDSDQKLSQEDNQNIENF